MEPRFNEVPRDWGNWFVISRVRYIKGSLYRGFVISRVRYIKGSLYQGFVISRVRYIKGSLYQGFVISRVRYIGVLFHTFYSYWDEEHRSLYRGIR